MPEPAGVAFGLVSLTNRVSTFVLEPLVALASRNADILSCHRHGLGDERSLVGHSQNSKDFLADDGAKGWLKQRRKRWPTSEQKPPTPAPLSQCRR